MVGRGPRRASQMMEGMGLYGAHHGHTGRVPIVAGKRLTSEPETHSSTVGGPLHGCT